MARVSGKKKEKLDVSGLAMDGNNPQGIENVDLLGMDQS
jgi:hypothetical protein